MANHLSDTAQKMKFSIKDFFSKCDQIPDYQITFTEEILNGKLHFFVQCNFYTRVCLLMG